MKRLLAVLFILAVGSAMMAAIFLGGCGGGSPDSADTLVIYSPHNPAIRDEFGRAFTEWYKQETGRTVTVNWPDAGGSSDILRTVLDKYKQNIHDVDIVFGGGSILSDLKQAGVLQAYRLPDNLLDALPKTIAGEPLYDPDFTWYGATISSFGLIYNKKLIADRRLPEVTQWSDMADPAFFGLVGVVDAAQSGSVRKAYEIVLQAYGYEKGMKILMLMGANARSIGRSSSDIPKDCAQGFIALGACIDFYAYRQIAAPDGQNLGFVLPKALTVINTDPIGILRDAPHLELAQAFERFVMSPAGQTLWCLKQGAPGGPQKETLGRYCVLPSIYTDRAADLVPGLSNPLDAPPQTFYNMSVEIDRIQVMPAYLKAMMVTNKELLTKAWKAVIDAGSPPELVAELTAPLVSEEEMLRLGRDVWAPAVFDQGRPVDQKTIDAEQDKRRRLRSDTELAWNEAFRACYDSIEKKARQGASR